MKIYEVTKHRSSFKIDNGVDLLEDHEGLSGKTYIKLNTDDRIYLHRTEPHINRLTRIEDSKLYAAHPLYRLSTGNLELGSDLLRDDDNQVMVVIRGCVPSPWSLEELYGADELKMFQSSNALRAIGETKVLTDASLSMDTGEVCDSIWLVRVGQGVRIDDTYTVAFKNQELSVVPNPEWIHSHQSQGHYANEVWV